LIATDRYGLPVTASSSASLDAYVDAVDRLLAGQPGIESRLADALAADPGFALAYAALARCHQLHGRGADARAAMARAVDAAATLTPRERSHVAALAKVVAGDGAGALALVREHLAAFPRDALVLAPCVGVFGLFGFSGRAGREHALAEFLAPLARHYGDDWWFLAVRAFAQAEIGDVEAARGHIERSMAGNWANANGAHVRAHVDYEAGADEAGLAWLERWHAGYDPAGLMHCHLAWHVALWHLDLGHRGDAWRVYEAHVHPGGAWGPPLNVVTDAASFLFRAELAGEPRATLQWREVTDHALAAYPQAGLAFVDVHVALACAMTGRHAELAARAAQARGPARELIAAIAQGFRAFAEADWPGAIEALEPACAEHERIGGSRAQRDLVEYALLAAAGRAGRRVARHRGRPLPPAFARRLA
jgi:hypothetical protein